MKINANELLIRVCIICDILLYIERLSVGVRCLVSRPAGKEWHLATKSGSQDVERNHCGGKVPELVWEVSSGSTHSTGFEGVWFQNK